MRTSYCPDEEPVPLADGAHLAGPPPYWQTARPDEMWSAARVALTVGDCIPVLRIASGLYRFKFDAHSQLFY
jgi:hypothetical protein